MKAYLYYVVVMIAVIIILLAGCEKERESIQLPVQIGDTVEGNKYFVTISAYIEKQSVSQKPTSVLLLLDACGSCYSGKALLRFNKLFGSETSSFRGIVLLPDDYRQTDFDNFVANYDLYLKFANISPELQAWLEKKELKLRRNGFLGALLCIDKDKKISSIQILSRGKSIKKVFSDIKCF